MGGREKLKGEELRSGEGWGWGGAVHNLGRVLRPRVDALALAVAAKDPLYSVVRYRRAESEVPSVGPGGP